MGPSRQDIQTIVENAKGRILDRVAQKQDIQSLNDNIRALINIEQQNQQLLRQAETQRIQLVNRAMALETRLSQLERDMQVCRHSLKQPHQSQRIVVPLPEGYVAGKRQFVYEPS
ncbi:hypothetical protein CR970_02455 [Candidatus Saccharibacteria bacterium]|nr:MAG: hypothetical protein CR970_02455 [Candidatus Saccharibacteria bacterium]